MPGRPPPLWCETLDVHQEDDPGESPFAGPLILVAIGRVLAIPISLYAVVHFVGIFLKPGVWSILTSPDSRAYHPLWAPTIVYEGVGKLSIFVCCIVLAWMFFARKRIFRPTIIIYSLLLLVFLWSDQFLAAIITAKHTDAASGTIARSIGTTIGTLIWVPYYLISDRVKRVFVR